MTDDDKHIISIHTKLNAHEDKELRSVLNRDRQVPLDPKETIPSAAVRDMLLWAARNQHLPTIAREVIACRVMLKNLVSPQLDMFADQVKEKLVAEALAIAEAT